MTKDESRGYRVLLREVDRRFQCRLCCGGAIATSWGYPRDVVRHLRRDHFGFGDACLNWFVIPVFKTI